MSKENEQATRTILVVEDNLGHVRLIQEALKEGTSVCELVAVKNGVEAMAYLRQEEPYKFPPQPSIVLLDLNLPKKDGREVLAEIKADPQLKKIPVLVLTTSKHEEDILKSYELHANCYINKSGDLRQLFKLVRRIEEFWLETATLPSQ